MKKFFNEFLQNAAFPALVLAFAFACFVNKAPQGRQLIHSGGGVEKQLYEPASASQRQEEKKRSLQEENQPE
jgi:hypothetical protein